MLNVAESLLTINLQGFEELSFSSTLKAKSRRSRKVRVWCATVFFTFDASISIYVSAVGYFHVVYLLSLRKLMRQMRSLYGILKSNE